MGIELQIGKWAAVVIMFCGLMGTGGFSLCAEAAQEKTEQTVENPQENGNPGTAEMPGQGIVLEAAERIEMKASPEKTAETLMTSGGRPALCCGRGRRWLVSCNLSGKRGVRRRNGARHAGN